jgi:hypothetical protein
MRTRFPVAFLINSCGLTKKSVKKGRQRNMALATSRRTIEIKSKTRDIRGLLSGTHGCGRLSVRRQSDPRLNVKHQA